MDHNVNVILRRDSLIDSISDHYRRRIFPDDLQDSSTDSSSLRHMPIAKPFNPFNEKCDMTHHTVDIKNPSIASSMQDATTLEKDESKQRSLKQKYIALSILLTCITVTAACTMFYSNQETVPYEIYPSHNYAEIYEKIRLSHVFPDSLSVFASNSDALSSDDVPVFLDLAGTESDFISSALSKCLNLKKGSILRKAKEQKASDPYVDFIYTDSLCSLSSALKQNQKARIFMLARNPSSRSILSFREKQDMNGPLFDERTLGLDFTKYIKSSLLDRDALTRSILCKENSILTDEDYATAKFFVDNYVTHGVFNDYRNSFIKFATKFNWPDFDQRCIDNVFQKGSMLTNRYVVGMKMIEFYDMLKVEHKYDTKLYSHIVSKV